MRAISLSERLAGLVGQDRVGNGTHILIADALAADARYNMWFYDNVKEGDLPEEATEEILFAKLDEHEAITDQCEAAIRAFQKGGALGELEAALRKFVRDIDAAAHVES